MYKDESNKKAFPKLGERTAIALMGGDCRNAFCHDTGFAAFSLHITLSRLC